MFGLTSALGMGSFGLVGESDFGSVFGLEARTRTFLVPSNRGIWPQIMGI